MRLKNSVVADCYIVKIKQDMVTFFPFTLLPRQGGSHGGGSSSQVI